MLLRVGLIGCGAIGDWHARIVAERPDCHLAAVCDPDLAPATATARSTAEVFPDAAAMLAAVALDAVIIASPEQLHVQHAQICALRGLPMLIEKPVAPNAAGVDAIIAAVASGGTKAMAGHVERFEVGAAQLKVAVEQGVCGHVVALAARRQFVAADVPRFAGRSSTLRVLGVHDFDLVSWIHPVAIDSVFAAAGRARIFAEHGLDDHVVTTIRFADGAVAVIESGWTLPLAYGGFATPVGWSPAGNNKIEVFGSAGMVSNDMGLRGQQLIAFDAREGFRAAGLRHQAIVHGRVVGALRDEVDQFIRMVRDRTKPLVTLDDARRAVTLTTAAELSLAKGAPVRLNGA